MVFHMKTTLNIPDAVMRQLKAEAARRGDTMSHMVETALRQFLQGPKQRQKKRRLPTFNSGGAKVDLANRTALHDAMDQAD
jgi:plasmid stability protein